VALSPTSYEHHISSLMVKQKMCEASPAGVAPCDESMNDVAVPRVAGGVEGRGARTRGYDTGRRSPALRVLLPQMHVRTRRFRKQPVDW
jgi:hypothetical protein